MQPPGLGMPMAPGSPTRLETRQANGGKATSPRGKCKCRCSRSGRSRNLGTTAGNLVDQ